MAPRISAAQKARFDAILADAMAGDALPALYLGITDVDGELYSHAVGRTVLDDPSSPQLGEDAVSWICSQTKLITTIAALQLIEAGKISLTTVVGVPELLPELANPVVVTSHDPATGKPLTTAPAVNQITFSQLLNHSSGLDYFVDGTTPVAGELLGMPQAYQRSNEFKGVADFFAMLKGDLPGIPLRFEPGTNFAYSWGLDCVGFIVERLSGKSLEQYFQDHIFAPLGITSASFYLTPELKSRLLPLARRNDDGTVSPWSSEPPVDMDPATVKVHFGGVGLYASQRDYLKLLRHLMQIKAGHAPARAILSRAYIDVLFTASLPSSALANLDGSIEILMPHLGVPSGGTQYSHGMMLNTVDIPGKRSAGTGSWIGWASSMYFVDAQRGVAMVFGTQLAPIGDDRVYRTYAQLETELYAIPETAESKGWCSVM